MTIEKQIETTNSTGNYLTALLVSLAGLLITSALAAQDFRPGYIVKNNTDTIKGFVVYRGDAKNGEGCIFKDSRKGTKNIFTIADIDGFGIIGDRFYQAMELPADAPQQGRVFVKVLVQGSINLYRYKDFFLIKRKDSLLITLPIPKNEVLSKPDDLKLKEDKKYVGLLNYLMFDCQMNFDKTSYSESALSEAVYKYNVCKNRGAKRNPRPMGKANFTVFTGFQNSTLTYEDNKVIPFNGTTMAVGGGIDLSSPRIFDRLFFTVDFWYSKILYQGYYEGTFAGDPLTEDIYAEFSNLKIPFGVKYNFRSPASTPFVRAGLFWSNTRSSAINTISTRELPEGILIDEEAGGYQVKNPKGYWLSVGYERRIYKTLQLFTEFRYEAGEGYLGSPVVNDSKISTLNFLVGLRF